MSLLAKFQSATCIWREEGFIALAGRVARKIQKEFGVVKLDGCWFGLHEVPEAVRGLLIAGTYESAERELISRHLDPSLPVLELGGCLGVVACIVNRKLTDPKKHLVVEPNPCAIPIITKNAANNRSGFNILNAAIAYGPEQVEFYADSQFLGSALLPVACGVPVTVPATTLKDVLEHLGADKCTLICDIEGAECDMVEHDLPAISTGVKSIIIETHSRFIGEAKTQKMLAMLAEAGFTVVDAIDDYVYVLTDSRCARR